MIIVGAALGALIGAFAGIVMHEDFRTFLGFDRHRIVSACILVGGLTGLVGGAIMAI